jgi:hypothetical protein
MCYNIITEKEMRYKKMAQFEILKAHLEAISHDAEVTYNEEAHEIRVLIDDFGGFDEHWREIDRELVNPAALDDFDECLYEASAEGSIQYVGDDWLEAYEVDGWVVVIHYTSEDI